MGHIKNVLLTGGNGFLGSFILKNLLRAGFRPILLLRPASNTWRISKEIHQCIVFILSGEKGEIERLFNLFEIDAVIHAATNYGKSSSLTELLKTNVLFPISLLEVGVEKQLKLFINTDSFFAKQNFNQIYLKEYSNSKRILEQLLKEFTTKTKIVNLRIEHVYGENDSEQKFFTSIVKKLMANVPEIELTNGQQKRDFIYAEEVANAYLAVIKNIDLLAEYQEYEVGTGQSISIRDFVEKIAKEIGSKSCLQFGALPTRQEDIPNSFARIESLNRLGWKQRYNTDQAIRRIIKKEKERFEL